MCDFDDVAPADVAPANDERLIALFDTNKDTLRHLLIADLCKQPRYRGNVAMRDRRVATLIRTAFGHDLVDASDAEKLSLALRIFGAVEFLKANGDAPHVGRARIRQAASRFLSAFPRAEHDDNLSCAIGAFCIASVI